MSSLIFSCRVFLQKYSERLTKRIADKTVVQNPQPTAGKLQTRAVRLVCKSPLRPRSDRFCAKIRPFTANERNENHSAVISVFCRICATTRIGKNGERGFRGL